MRIYLNYTTLFISILLLWGNSSAQTTEVFSYTGSEQSWTVPAGVTSIDVKLWGAGGGGEYNFSSGGSGAFVKGTLAVNSGETYKIVVGGGGIKANTSGTANGGYGGGGKSGNYSAGGGGYSGIFINSVTQANTKAIAGGGGGGAPSAATTRGGAGGGPNGTQGGNTGGGGGTTSAGGAASGNSSTAGSLLSGGNGGSGGGGGGGYFGGGGGGNNKAGGGGSSFTTPLTSVTNTVGAVRTDGATAQAPGSGESGYVAGVGNGGKTKADGGNGLIIITYTVSISADYFCELSNISKTTWCAGETANVNIKVKNAGTQNWTAGDNVKLIAKWDNGSWVEGSAITLNAGADNTYSVSMTAPATGTHTLSFDLKKGSDMFSANTNGIGPGNSVLSNNTITVNGLPTANAGGNKSVSCLGSVQLGINANIASMAASCTNNTNLTNAGGTQGITLVKTPDFENATSATYNYNDYTSNIMTAVQGSSFNLELTVSGSPKYYGVWIDWNNDGTFQAGEFIANGQISSGSAVVIPVTVPVSAASANCRMRIRTQGTSFSSGNACTKLYAETEDYTVRVGNSYTYSWSPSDFLNAVNISDPTVTNITENKTYTLEVTDTKTGCKATDNAAVTVTPSSLTSSLAVSSNNICHGSSVTLSGTVSNASGSWTLDLSNGGGAVSGTGNSSWSKSVTPAATTTYSISSITGGGCAGAAAATQTVTLPSKGTALAGNNEEATCYLSGNNPVYFYAPSGNYIGSINPNGRTGSVTMSTIVGSPAIQGACDVPSDPKYLTAYMGRVTHVDGSGLAGTGDVDVILAYSNSELLALQGEAGDGTGGSTPGNTVDDITDLANPLLGITKVGGDGSLCSGNNVSYLSTGGGVLNVTPAISDARYVSFSVPDFSSFYMHGANANSPLPITLTSFTVFCEDKINLMWKTATETNVSHFEILRSRNGQLWEVVTTVDAVGNSTTENSYITTDATGMETMYYKLRSVDNDGTREDFQPVSVTCHTAVMWNIHPAPASEKVTLTIHSDRDIADVLVVTDLNGRSAIVRSVDLKTGVNIIIVDIDSLTEGSYMVNMQNSTDYKPLRLIKMN